ncbi:MAG: glutamate--cysteine ligase, partial [Planctomycetota bacterium]
MRALDVDDLAGWLAEGCKPEARWRIGTEHEKIGFLADSLRPLPYDGERSVRRILELMAGITGWEIVREDGLPIALADPHSPASVTLEPGGQLELSGAPLASLFDTCRETTDHLELLSEISRRLRTGFLSLG